MMELVRDIAQDLDLVSLCFKILLNVGILTNGDRCSLFLIFGSGDQRYVLCFVGLLRWCVTGVIKISTNKLINLLVFSLKFNNFIIILFWVSFRSPLKGRAFAFATVFGRSSRMTGKL